MTSGNCCWVYESRATICYLLTLGDGSVTKSSYKWSMLGRVPITVFLGQSSWEMEENPRICQKVLNQGVCVKPASLWRLSCRAMENLNGQWVWMIHPFTLTFIHWWQRLPLQDAINTHSNSEDAASRAGWHSASRTDTGVAKPFKTAVVLQRNRCNSSNKTKANKTQWTSSVPPPPY